RWSSIPRWWPTGSSPTRGSSDARTSSPAPTAGSAAGDTRSSRGRSSRRRRRGRRWRVGGWGGDGAVLTFLFAYKSKTPLHSRPRLIWRVELLHEFRGETSRVGTKLSAGRPLVHPLSGHKRTISCSI